MPAVNLLGGLSLEETQADVLAKLSDIYDELLEKVDTGEPVALDNAAMEALNAIADAIAATAPSGTVALDASTLAALEIIQANVSGTVALDSGSLAALEQITATLSGPVALDSATLAALEAITATISGTVAVSGTVALTPATLAALEEILITGTVALDAPSLAALEQIMVSGTVALDSGSLAALEQITATLSGPVALDSATLAALEQITASISGTVTVGGTVAIDSASIAALDDVKVVATPGSVFTGSISAAGNIIGQQDAMGRVNCLQLTGTWVGTVLLEGSNDGTVWQALGVTGPTSSIGPYTNITAGGIYYVVTPTRYFRVRCSAYTSGTIVATVYQTAMPINYTAQFVDTELAAAAALADAVGNPTVPTVGAANLGYNGATFDRLRTGGQLAATGKLAVLTGTSPLTSLSAATAAGAGTSQNFGAALTNWALQVVTGGTVTAAKVRLELSLNGTNWWTAGVWDLVAGPQTSGDIVSILNRPASYARANLESISGGGNVTALVIGAP